VTAYPTAHVTAHPTAHATALIADDEPLLRDALKRQLAAVWPELEVIAEARNGREAIALFERQPADVCFLDIQMPGLSGVDAANRIGHRAHLVFVTAHDHYAVEAFAQGALDYLLKPVEAARLAETVRRLRERLEGARPAVNTEALLRELTAQLEQLRGGGGPAPLRWIRAQVGQTLRMIAVDDVDYVRSDRKYTVVAWRDEAGQPAQALIRVPLKDLAAQLDPQQFVQVHRSIVVNLRAVAHVRRHDNETAEIRLKNRKDVLPVSRSFVHLFRQM
jgi:DNA-binding LytR/AlgR family response regulator